MTDQQTSRTNITEALRHEVHWIDAGRDEPPENGYWKCTCGKTFAPDGVDEYAKHLAAEPRSDAVTAPDEPGLASSDFAVAVGDLSQAYYSIPAGQPTTEQVMDRLPALYAAIEAVLDSAGRYGGLIAAVADAERRGLPVYITTEPREARAASASVPPLDELTQRFGDEMHRYFGELFSPDEHAAAKGIFRNTVAAAYAAEPPEQDR